MKVLFNSRPESSRKLKKDGADYLSIHAFICRCCPNNSNERGETKHPITIECFNEYILFVPFALDNNQLDNVVIL